MRSTARPACASPTRVTSRQSDEQRLSPCTSSVARPSLSVDARAIRLRLRAALPFCGAKSGHAGSQIRSHAISHAWLTVATCALRA
eukprot:5705822-Pleurochrysis_carterae.AAC.4